MSALVHLYQWSDQAWLHVGQQGLASFFPLSTVNLHFTLLALSEAVPAPRL